MKLYILTLLFSISLSLPLFGVYTEIKKQIENLKEEYIPHTEQENSFKFWFNSGVQSGLKSSLLVINMWIREHNPISPPRVSIKRDLYVLMSISSQISYEGFEFPEGYWYEQGYRHGLTQVILLLDRKASQDD